MLWFGARCSALFSRLAEDFSFHSVKVVAKLQSNCLCTAGALLVIFPLPDYGLQRQPEIFRDDVLMGDGSGS